jgi:hypothetical protein
MAEQSLVDIEVANGKVQVMRHYYDMVTMLQQLGALSRV